MKKRICLLTVFILLVQYFLPVITGINGVWAAVENSGDEPLKIGTLEEFKDFAENIEQYKDKEVHLTANIDLECTQTKTWTPISNFEGVFDGGGYTISGIYLGDSGDKATGLFAQNSGIIQNLNINTSTIKIENTSVSDSLKVGLLVGNNMGTVKNIKVMNMCTVDVTNGEISTSEQYKGPATGGIVGYNSGKILKSTNEANVTSNNCVGGIVGINDSVVQLCKNEGNNEAMIPYGAISGGIYIGGIVGYQDSQSSNTDIVQYCYNTGTISGTANTEGKGYLGGIVGYSSTSIKNSYNVGIIGVTSDFESGPITGSKGGHLSCCYGDEMENENIIAKLNSDADMFVEDTKKVNNGYPVLRWVESIEMSKTPDKTEYIQNQENLELTGGKIQLNYNDGTTSVIDITNDMVSGFNNETVGKNTITVTYNDTVEDYTTTFNVYIGNANTHYIGTKEKFEEFAENIEQYKDKEIHLTDDIDLECTQTNSWTPISDFTGIFDGKGHTISGIYLTYKEDAAIGLFAQNSGTIQNLNISNSTIDIDTNGSTSNLIKVGLLVGNNMGTISRVNIEKNENEDGGEIPLAITSGNIESSNQYDGPAIGGIAGYNNGEILKCTNNASILSNNCVGGIVGINDSTVQLCNNTGTIIGEIYAGGIVGCEVFKTLNAKLVDYCYNTGKIQGVASNSTTEGNKYLGGIVGYSRIMIKNSYNTGSIEAKNGEYDGQIAGHAYSVDNCYYKQHSTNSELTVDAVGNYAETEEGLERVQRVYEKTETEMQDKNITDEENIINLLNNGQDWFVEDAKTINNGYPILKWVKSIEISKTPDDTEYKQNEENLDITGGKIKLKYNDGSYSEDIVMTNDMVSGFNNATIGKNEIVVTYNDTLEDLKTTFNVQITGEILKEIKVIKSPSTTTYIQNAENKDIDLKGGELTLVYEDGSEKPTTFEDTNIEVIKFDTTKVGPSEIVVRYIGTDLTASFPITIIQNTEGPEEPDETEKTITSIAVTTKPKTEYTVGDEKLDLTGGKLTITYEDGTEAEVDLDDTTKVTVSTFDSSKAGIQAITVGYKGTDKTTTFQITIKATEPEEPDETEKTITSIAVTTKPKTEYTVGDEKLDLTGGKLTITYEDGTEAEVELDDTTNVTVSTFDSSEAGTQEITVGYKGTDKTTTFEITIKEAQPEETEKTITSIAVTTEPTQKQYIQNYEKLNLGGGVLTIYYSDGSSSTLKLEDAKVTNFNNTKEGTNTLTVEYMGKTTTFNVEIIQKGIEGIKVTTKPVKANYIQNYDKLNLEGGIITVYYNDKSTGTVRLENSDSVKVTNFNNTIVGTNKLTVEYMGKTTTFDVQIVEKSIIGIEVGNPISKLQYKRNTEKLDLTGGILKVKYNDKTTGEMQLTDSKIEVIGFDNTKLGKNVITVKYAGFETEFEVEIIGEQGDPTVSKDPIPPAGIKATIIIALLSLTMIAYISYKKHDSIKLR